MSKKNVQAQKNQGMALLHSGRFPEAGKLFTEICRISPGDAEAWFMLCAINGTLGHMAEAIRCGRQAVVIRPDYVDAHYNLGQAYKRLNDWREAEQSFRHCVQFKPDYAEAWDNLGYVLQEQGMAAEAIRCYQEALRLRPDFSGTRYLLSALGGAEAPAQAPAEYVRGLFDGYAGHFDTHLGKVLECRIPDYLNQAVRQAIPTDRRGLNVLDLGCGTGLCGALVRDLAHVLVGVDLSPQMIEVARAKKIYDTLLVGDITLPCKRPARPMI